MQRVCITPIISKCDFIEKCNEIHKNNIFDYSLIPDSFKKTDRLCIICNKHGKFTTTYYKIIEKKNGCKECEKEYRKEQRRLYYQNKLIEESKIVHNNFYNYDKVYYRGKDIKVTITCPIHGDFEQTPHEHKSGSGCKECARQKSIERNRKTTEWFIEKANNIHHNFYNYDKTVYSTSDEKVIITCPIHGDFEMRAASHLQGSGCPKCANSRKGYGKGNKPEAKTTEQFIEESKEIFGDFYDYSKTKYVNARTDVIITCPIHGDFEIVPLKHLSAHQGCPECGKLKSAESNRYTIDDFIRIGNMYFNNYYNYSETTFTDIFGEVEIICPKHGKFKTYAYSHMRGDGECPMCVKERKTRTVEEFINAANTIYKEFYDYSEVEFVDDYTEIKVICPIHGPFYVTPKAHLRNYKGCPECRLTDIEREIIAILKDNDIDFETQKTFDWLKFKNNMHLDIYIESVNIAIECQGPQHFKLCEFYGYTEETFELYQQRDIKKKQLCNEHGINILYFSNIQYVENYELGTLYTNKEDILRIILKAIQQ